MSSEERKHSKSTCFCFFFFFNVMRYFFFLAFDVGLTSCRQCPYQVQNSSGISTLHFMNCKNTIHGGEWLTQEQAEFCQIVQIVKFSFPSHCTMSCCPGESQFTDVLWVTTWVRMITPAHIAPTCRGAKAP